MFTNVDASSNLGTWQITKVADGQAYFKMVSYVSAKGATGATGNGIKSIKEHYAVSTSNTVTPTSWLDDVPVTNPVNKYLWNYETVTYTNGTSVDSKRELSAYMVIPVKMALKEQTAKESNPQQSLTRHLQVVQ